MNLNQGISNGIRGATAQSSRALVRGFLKTYCDCGHASVLPTCHAEACGYRKFWEQAARDANETRKGQS